MRCIFLISFPLAAATHYEDPAKGCGSDEQAIQVTGVSGDFCSPPCSGTTCPSDPPSASDAKPQCALKSSTGAQKCALICTPGSNAACPTGASCQSIQGTGICTYPGAGNFENLSMSVPAAAKYSKGYKRSSANANITVAALTPADIANAPDSIDWSAKGATTPVNDQGSCGSCWAFSTTEGVESAVYMSTGKLPAALSTQELVACEKQDGGCDGGDIPTAVTYLKKEGVVTNKAYPDTSSKSGKNGKCKIQGKKAAVKVTGMQYAIPPCSSGDCSSQNEEALAAALAKYGPISICINSGDGQSGDWMKYKSGVLTGSCKAKANLLDHCVQLVGYDKKASEPYWKIRNSWATSYGEEGFIRIPYGKKNTCCVGCEAVIISASNEETASVVV